MLVDRLTFEDLYLLSFDRDEIVDDRRADGRFERKIGIKRVQCVPQCVRGVTIRIDRLKAVIGFGRR